MNPYIPVGRRFALAEKEELRNPDYRSLFGVEPDGIFKVVDLIDLAPVVVLGEGRSGKSREFETEVKRLKSLGCFAFLVPLERLQDETFEDALSLEDEEAFKAWKNSPEAVAFFFLDALDELKLREGSLRIAVRKFRDACTPYLDRLRLVLSCRPADWNSQIDSQYLAPFCIPQKSDAEATAFSDPEEFFIEIISRAGAGKKIDVNTNDIEPGKIDDNTHKHLTVVSLLPLSKKEIRKFAELYSSSWANEFYEYLERTDFWHLYRLPAEIIDCIDQIAAGEPLGTIEDQVRLSIHRKLSEVESDRPQLLSLERALEGAERIALALYLLKKRSIRLHQQGHRDDLDLGSILTNWTPDEQQELIGKSLFEASGVSSIQFHHRASQEYLAAKRIHHLRQSGMNHRDVFALLFSDVGGIKVIKPSMAPMAAWLSIWNPDIQKLVLEREPRLLFNQGLPSALPIETRANAVRSYVSQYAGKGRCRVGIGHTDLKRAMHPELAPIVRELWETAYTGEDSRELFLEMIWLTPLPECSDLAFSAAFDSSLSISHRMYAAWGVVAAGTDEEKEQLKNAALTLTLPQNVIVSFLPGVVPGSVSVQEFFDLVERFDVSNGDVDRINFCLQDTIKNGFIDRSGLIFLRDRFANAIKSTRNENCEFYKFRSGRDYYVDALLACVGATIPVDSEDATDWAKAIVVATHFGESQVSITKDRDIEIVLSTLNSNPHLRELFFWEALNLADELDGQEDDWSRFIGIATEAVRSIEFGSEDKDWLFRAVGSNSDERRRGVAFFAAIEFLRLRQNPAMAEELLQIIQDKPDWIEHLDRVLNPKPDEPTDWQIRLEKRNEELQAKEQKRIEDWLDWRREVLSSPSFLMDGDRRLDVLFNAQKIIGQSLKERHVWGHWDSSVIAQTMGLDFLEAYKRELASYWRETDVQLRSERPDSERNKHKDTWLLALSAVKAESEVDRWEERLTNAEANRAARLACIDLNGFGGFIVSLEKAHPEIVADVVVNEILAELKQIANTQHCSMLHDVRYHGTDKMKCAVASKVAPNLALLFSEEDDLKITALKDAIKIISDSGDADSKRYAILYLEDQIKSKIKLSLCDALALLGLLDAESACNSLLLETENIDDEEVLEVSAGLFACVFSDRYSESLPDLNTISSGDRIKLLHMLVLRAYQIIRREDDIEHEGAYTPNERDYAQSARSFVLNSLLNEKDIGALRAINDLAQAPEFAHMSDRLKQIKYEIAAQISDVTPHTLVSFQALDRDGAFIPFDQDSLHTAMMTQLDAFEHDVLHAEDTPAAAFRALTEETDLRRSISNWLRHHARGVFQFPQEAVVVGENRPDIRCYPRSMDGYATIELKRQRWSVRELEVALTDQLVGQYLQHENCKTGCLLICQGVPKVWHHPDTNSSMNLAQVVDHLNEIAKEIMSANPEVRVSVKGIDYSTS